MSLLATIPALVRQLAVRGSVLCTLTFEAFVWLSGGTVPGHVTLLITLPAGVGELTVSSLVALLLALATGAVIISTT